MHQCSIKAIVHYSLDSEKVGDNKTASSLLISVVVPSRKPCPAVHTDRYDANEWSTRHVIDWWEFSSSVHLTLTRPVIYDIPARDHNALSTLSPSWRVR